MHSIHRSWRAGAAAGLMFAVLLPVSCASAKLGSRPEPGVIAIRNLSGAEIAEASLRKAGPVTPESRYGSVSPVPNGLTQEVGRPSNPPPLPKRVALEWIDGAGRTQVRELEIGTALQGASGGRGEALVFEIGRSGAVRVFVEARTAATPRN